MSASNTAFSALSFITFFLVCIPFPWHLEAWNTGTCLYMAWTALGLLTLFINSVIWADNAINYAPVWCDISSKIIIGLSIAIPAASLCINHRLYCIAAVRSVTRTKAEKYRAIMVDLSIGLGIPIVVMVLHYIVQGHRFNIFEQVGCYPFTYNTPPAYFLVFMVPLPIGLISGTYSVMSIVAFRKRHAEFKEILSSNSNLNSNRFFRLMALAGIEVICCVPLSITTIILNATRGEVRPWISWEDTHYGFSRVDQVPAVLWRADPTANVSIEMSRWLVIVCGLVFFAFFGFADEAQKHYKLAFDSVAKRVGYTSNGTTKVGSGNTNSTGFTKSFNKSKGTASANGTSLRGAGAGMPIFISQDVVEKRDSLDTLSDLTSIKDSEFASEVGSRPPSQFNTLTKESGLVPPAIVSSAESTNSTSTIVEPRPPTRRPISFPTSVTPSDGSFLDLSPSEPPRAGNDNRV
ncbi:pheromone A receptor-domain-containing protein [Gymnopilus junonius]|uniref:Pheromone A receptor-domain-containing protein n=1 Tax=Gymnopilus junonius TaxID=109634 RepID=A0A9P5TMI3_GYMJU|nr:pheromone A receptor-domain-containing protein [Gymnopilus junonius]